MKREFRVTIEAESSAGIQLLHGRTTTDCNGLKHPKSGGSEQVKA